MGWFVIILLILIFCWPWIWKFIQGRIRAYMARRAEDMMRRMMGMPPRDDKKKRADKQRGDHRSAGFTADEYQDEDSSRGHSRGRGRQHRNYRIAALMQLVAVDVEYVEIKEFSSTVIGEDGAGTYSFRYEEQITDVKFVEIKD